MDNNVKYTAISGPFSIFFITDGAAEDSDSDELPDLTLNCSKNLAAEKDADGSLEEGKEELQGEEELQEEELQEKEGYEELQEEDEKEEEELQEENPGSDMEKDEMETDRAASPCLPDLGAAQQSIKGNDTSKNDPISNENVVEENGRDKNNSGRYKQDGAVKGGLEKVSNAEEVVREAFEDQDKNKGKLNSEVVGATASKRRKKEKDLPKESEEKKEKDLLGDERQENQQTAATEDQPRRRRAAAKITSFKEASVNR